MLLKMIFTYSIVSFIVLGTFSYIVVDKVSLNLTEDINQSAERMTSQSYNTADILLSSTYNYFSSVFAGNQDVYYAMYGNQFTSREMYQISSLLNELKAANPLIQSLYIYNMNNNFVFSSGSSVRSIEDFYDTQMTAMLNGENLHQQGLFIPRKFQVRKEDTAINNLISIIYAETKKNGGVEGAFVINLDQELLQKMVSKGSGNNAIQSFIVNRSGDVISHTNGSMFEKNVSEYKYIKRIFASYTDQGKFIEDINGRSSFVSYVKSDRLGWVFISTAENDSMLVKVNKLKRYIVTVTVVFIGTALLFALFSVRYIYQPISQLTKRLASSALEEKMPPLSEYEIMLHSFQRLESRIRDLKKDISGYLPAKKKEVLQSMIQTGVPNQPEDRRLLEVGLTLNGDHYQVLILRIDDYTSQFQRYDQADISLFKYAISNIAEEIIRPGYDMEVWTDNDDALGLLLYWKDKASTPTLIDSLIREVQQSVTQYLKMSLTVAIGSVVDELAQIPMSYHLAYQASRYRLTHGPGSLIRYEDRPAEDAQHDYPLQLEKLITDHLRLGERNRLEQLVGSFFRELVAFKYDEIMLYVYQLSVMTLRTASDMVSEEELTRSGMLSLPETITKCDTLDEMCREFLRSCHDIIAMRDLRSCESNTKIVSLVQQKIVEHYGDPDLSADKLAEQVGMSTNYLRKLFKDQTGCTISQYITEVRFETAKRLLLETDHSAGKVGEMVGILNTNYFYASFKKHVGMSPVHFRKEHKLGG
jgi:AraC-like DNA-binding protein